MIYITGDVHSPIKHHWEQKIAGSEFDAAVKYLTILKKYNLKATIFLNGISLDKYPKEFEKIKGFDIEVGGHTYDNYGKKNIIKSYLKRKIWRCVYGSTPNQKKDIQKTKKAFEKAGLKMNSWRTHAFASNEKTFELLRRFGVKYVSDLFNKKPFEKKEVVHLPINIPVDNNTIIYGKQNPENRDPFLGCVKGRITPKEWFEILKKRIRDNEKKKVESIILIHPITMAVLDNFKLFEEIARFLSKYKSAKISEFKLK